MTHVVKRLFHTENYIYRLYALIALLIIGGVITHNALQYRAINDEVNQLAYREAKLLDEYYASIRRIYSASYANAGLDVSKETIALLPIHAASAIGNDFRRHSAGRGMLIRNVSDRTRNLNNTPTPYEQEAIRYFKENPDAREYSRILTLNRQSVLFYASPIKIEPHCLMCHGKREDAPPYVRENCINGYDYTLGDVRGVVSITVERSALLSNVQEKYRLYFLYSGAIAAAILVLMFLIVRRAKTIEHRLLSSLKRLSYKDTLTNLYNRRKQGSYLEEYHHLFERYKDPYSLIMVDIDHFKEVNDTYGHPAGDTVLKEMAKILRSSTRQTDHAARWGGEEFLILCPKTTLEQAAVVAQSLRQKISAHPFTTVGHKTASFGVAQVREGESVPDLLERVDAALYRAKKEGRDRVVIAEE